MRITVSKLTRCVPSLSTPTSPFQRTLRAQFAFQRTVREMSPTRCRKRAVQVRLEADRLREGLSEGGCGHSRTHRVA